jgi:hypothetical protein
MYIPRDRVHIRKACRSHVDRAHVGYVLVICANTLDHPSTTALEEWPRLGDSCLLGVPDRPASCMQGTP